MITSRPNSPSPLDLSGGVLPLVEFAAPPGLVGVSRRAPPIGRGECPDHAALTEALTAAGPPTRIVVGSSMQAFADGVAGWLRRPDLGWWVEATCYDSDSVARALQGPGIAVAVLTDDLLEAQMAATLATRPDVRVVALTTGPSAPHRQATCIRAGAHSVTDAAVSQDGLTNLVAELVAGRVTLPVDAVRLVVHGDTPELTSRQREVLELLAAGRTTTQIAESLVVTPSTVKSHLKEIQARCGVTGQRMLLAHARDLLATSPAPSLRA